MNIALAAYNRAFERQPGKSHFDRNILYYAVIVFIYIQLSPMYIFPRGIPQPADILLALAIFPALPIVFLSAKKAIPSYYLAGSMFVAATMLINWINYIFSPDARLLLSSVYYLYNFLIFTFVCYLFRYYPQQMRSITYAALVVAVFTQFSWLMLFPDVGTKRMTGSFVNPNQLGYWSLICLMILAVLRHKQRFHWQDGAIIAILTYFEMLALSKAGLIAFGLALVVFVFLPQTTKMARWLLGIAIIAFMFSGFFYIDRIESLRANFSQVGLVVDRLEGIGQSRDDSPEGRNYDRLIQFPEYMLLGAGEGAFWRFDHYPNEIHSGVATLIFSYGIAGTFSYFTFLFLLLKRQPWYYAALVGCVILYGLVHQYMRFSDYWFFLGILYATRFFPAQKDNSLAHIFRKSNNA